MLLSVLGTICLVTVAHSAILTHPAQVSAKTYDFVVIGSGAAGSVVAHRLAEVPTWRVLLVEAGPKFVVFRMTVIHSLELIRNFLSDLDFPNIAIPVSCIVRKYNSH